MGGPCGVPPDRIPGRCRGLRPVPASLSSVSFRALVWVRVPASVPAPFYKVEARGTAVPRTSGTGLRGGQRGWTYPTCDDPVGVGMEGRKDHLALQWVGTMSAHGIRPLLDQPAEPPVRRKRSRRVAVPRQQRPPGAPPLRSAKMPIRRKWPAVNSRQR